MWLSPSQAEQDNQNVKSPHRCGKYGKPLIHGIFHPEIIQLDECEVMKKERIIKMFEVNQELKVTFTKKDGSVRVMHCTRKLDLIPTVAHPKTEKKPPEDSLPVFDLEAMGWRSFKFDAVIGEVEIVKK
jgi:hypothetical protein